jgi:hypothetical protein
MLVLSKIIPPSVTNLTQRQFFSLPALPNWIFAFPRVSKSCPLSHYPKLSSINYGHREEHK